MMLDGSGYDVYTVCHSKAELLRTVSDMDEVLIIMGYKLPDGTVDDVYDDLMEGQKLMSIVKAEKMCIRDRAVPTCKLIPYYAQY